MKPIDIVIIVAVVLIMGLIIYFRFIKNKNSECASCAKVDKYKLNRLRAYYEKNKKE
ncbi:MAG: hypothetical protein WBK54_05585 [Bacilli bacterium]|nr:hypothetical protein [Acholeplasmataceae bacterium]